MTPTATRCATSARMAVSNLTAPQGLAVPRCQVEPATPPKPLTATRQERCAVCGERFTGTEAGDLHRVVDHTYLLVRLSGEVRRVRTGEAVPKGAQVLSRGNQSRRCLSAEEMKTKGMTRNETGAWSRGGSGRRTARTATPWAA